jgi:penicillin-binding protein 2
MKPVHPNERHARARAAGWILATLLGILIVSFFRAQVVRGTAWALQSDSNRLRVLPMAAPRGTIFDRTGKIIADNVPSYSVSLFPAPVDSVSGMLRRLQPILTLSDERVESLVEVFRQNRRLPLLVKSNLQFEEISALEELRPSLPGMFLETRPRRRYIGGESLGHVIGFVGEVSGAELESTRFRGYERGMIVGKDGLERQYEEVLQGTQGVRYVEVDAVGRVVGSFEGYAAASALPGDELRLHLDLDLQRYVHRIFPAGYRGAVVALDVEDGGILALYSAPSFDPSAFVGGIGREQWEQLNTDPARPLFNRAAVGRYPPASTWKLATAAIGLELGVISPTERMPTPCYGSYQFGNVVRRCWNPDGHGHQDLAAAIAHSCNVYFYQLGLRIGLRRLIDEGSRLGFGERCGVDLPRESAGVFPEGVEFWERRFGYRPFENEVLALSIGQGPNDQTPLKMAQFYLAIARGGDAPAPRLMRAEADSTLPLAWSMDLSPASIQAMQQGLRQVTSAGGTAFLASLEHWDLIGKTGTAQNDPTGERYPHAWFAGMAGPWGGAPEVVIVVLVEEGQSGSGLAAPIAAKAADFYLRSRHGIEPDSIQTLGEHLRSGTPAPWARWAPTPVIAEPTPEVE